MDHNIVATQVTLAGISVALINWLKSTKYFPWATVQTKKLNRIIGLLTAAVGAIGVHFTWAAGDTSGTYIFTVTGATLQGIGSGAWVWAKQFVMQELVYRMTANQQQAFGSNPALIAPQGAPKV